MIERNTVKTVVEEWLSGNDYFLVDVTFTPDDRIVVEIDHADGVWIEDCAELSRFMQERFGDELGDYELEVGSAGIGQPFKVEQQYLNHIGKDVEVLDAEGKKVQGVLKQVDGRNFVVTVKEKQKLEGKKRPQLVDVDKTFNMDNIKYTKYPYVEFTGKGEIPWTQVQEAINANNQAATDPNGLNQNCIVVKPNDLYVDTIICSGVWKGYILLSDGSWLEIAEVYNAYEDGYYTAIKRRFPPKVEIPDVSFKASVHTLVSLPDNDKEEVIKIVNTNVKEESDGE